MCGMAGAYCPSVLSDHEVRKVQKLLVLNHWRGEDSSGMFDLVKNPKNKQPTVLCWKRKMHPVFFAYNVIVKALAERWKDNKPSVVAVHARAATIGDVSTENAHPFVTTNLIGMHNGTVSGKFKGKDDYGTDSEAIYQLIDEIGLKPAIKEIGVSAAYALVWYDMRDHSLNFLRNSQRPLHFYQSAGTLYWSSDHKDLRYACDANTTWPKALEYKSGEEDNNSVPSNEIFIVPENVHLKFNTRDNSITFRATTVRAYESRVYRYDGGAANANGFFPETEIKKLPRPTSGTNTTTDTDGINHLEWNEPFWFPKSYKDFDSVCLATQPNMDFPFAIELGCYLAKRNYAALQLFRIRHHKEFVERLVNEFNRVSLEEKKRRMKRVGMSKNEYKKLITFRDASYINKPYHLNHMGEKVYNQFLLYNLRHRPPPFTPSEDAEVVKESNNRKIGTRSVSLIEYANYLDKNNCACCGDPVMENEDVLWVSEQDYMCEACQEEAVKQPFHIVYETFPQIKQEEISRHIEARNENKPTVTRNVG